MGLLFQLPEQQRPDGWCERKCPQTGLGLCGVGHDLYVLPVKSAGSNRVADCDGVALEVDCTPSETKQFAFSQTIECCELDRYFKDVTFDAVKQFIDFCAGVEAADVFFFPRALDFVSRITVDDVLSNSVTQRPVDDCVIVNHGTGRYTLQLSDVEILNPIS